MDWFQRITGFAEDGYDETRARLSVVDGRLHSLHTSRSFAVGRLETPSLAELRQRSESLWAGQGRTTVRCVSGDVRQLHRDARNAGAVFQVASQFNLLEMVGPAITPEHGVTGYQHDPTQGPACAIACGAGTIYRNYFVPVNGQTGQTRERQIDGLRDVGAWLGNGDGSLWQMRNGYCLLNDGQLATLDDRMAALGGDEHHALGGLLRIGVHSEVEVTDGDAGHLVDQVYASALPVAYNRVRQPARWERFARLVLDAAYEATLRAAALRRADTGRARVLLTRLGGGAFGNDPRWIDAAIGRALGLARDAGLEVQLVSFGPADAGSRALAAAFTR